MIKKTKVPCTKLLIGCLIVITNLACLTLLAGFHPKEIRVKTPSLEANGSCYEYEDTTQFSKLTDHVNVFIGTSNHANNHPGPVMPWGMVSLSPLNSYDTISKVSDSSPYYFEKPYISGFTHLNMSGPGCPDMVHFA